MTYAERMSYTNAKAAVVRNMLENEHNASIISFSGNAPADEALPAETLRELASEVLSVNSRGIEALGNSSPIGVSDLRNAVMERLLAPKGINADFDEVMIFNGAMEVLYLTGQALLNYYDVVLFEAPSFIQARQALELQHAVCVACETDDCGYIISDVESKIKRYKPKLIYVNPTFQNPSGRTMSADRRERLVRLAEKHEIPIFEDDPYSDLRYSGSAVPPLKRFDKTGNVIYAGSFSNIFSPGSRLGFAYAFPETIKKLYDVKTAVNSYTSTISQVLCSEFFKRGFYEPHIARICELYKNRRDTMTQCLKSILPPDSSFTCPDGGFFIWVTLPDSFDTTDLLKSALENDVSFLPGEIFYTFGQPVEKNCMRLCFGSNTPEKISEGMERLARVIKER